MAVPKSHPDLKDSPTIKDISDLAKKMPSGTYICSASCQWAVGTLVRLIPELKTGFPQFEDDQYSPGFFGLYVR